MSAIDLKVLKKKTNKLTQRPKIAGVNGLWSEVLGDYFSGISDGKHNQIREDDPGTFISPYIHRKEDKTAAYINSMYSEASEVLGVTASNIHAKITEMGLLQTALSDMESTTEDNPEITARTKAKIEATKDYFMEVLSDLSSARELIHTLDDVVAKHVERSFNERNASINRYWRGVLKKSPIVELKSKPAYGEMNDSAYSDFKEKVNSITRELNNVAGGDFQ